MSRPVRMCIGCRGRSEKSELIRIVVDGESVRIDHRQTSPGRGAYLHPDEGCIVAAGKRRAYGRALRADVNNLAVAERVRTGLGALT